MIQRIAFIDTKINLDYINQFISKKQNISGVYIIKNDMVIQSRDKTVRDITHATMCAKMFIDNCTEYCDISFVQILEDGNKKANISHLLISLEWCLRNSINIVNLSIGTTSLTDVPPLYKIVKKLTRMGVVVVCATSNRKKMTFPACFKEVIGVRSLRVKSGCRGYIYNGNCLDGIDISYYLSDEIIKYRGKYYTLPSSNSLVAPIITAKVCNLLNNGTSSMRDIEFTLKKASIKPKYDWYKNFYREYFKAKVTVPIIAILNNIDTDSTIILLSEFEKNGYIGFCLSDSFNTDIEKKIINLLDFNSYRLVQKIRFYSHYCNADFIILHVNNKRTLSKLKLIDFDVIIDKFEHKRIIGGKGIKYINTDKYENIEELFLELYPFLL
ncbi:S8 family serine peptidase [Lacrimispora xylanolytica]|uniref:Peptidase S8/S53 domain-containing protein n=1 Tax=Lacrimispora xylanolytica TaxID=29375 RepID=A0ABY7AD89_9FIRM|nr:S8 family serine peptidase [Lacrimispora xylanolytica]WAJ23763.1 hypothetical protein OW255_19765 [Lacrimispora xylanolytica]